ncbi:ankyrin repeat domain-containing protein [Thermaurantiacus sp.]
MRRLLLAFLLLAPAAPAAGQQFSDGYNFLKAVRERDVLAAKQLIDKPGSVVVNTRDRGTGESALHIATRRRDTPWMAFLLQNGADPNIRDNEGNTPLILAAATGFVDGVRVMLAGKAQIDAVNSKGQTGLFKAVELRDLATVRLLLEQGASADMAEYQTGMTPRDLAASDPRAGAIAKLLAEAPRRPRTAAAGPKP